MRTLLDAGRVLRSVLGFSGHYRVASFLSVVLAVGFFVYHGMTP